jgi:excisionase family DNA binding protein
MTDDKILVDRAEAARRLSLSVREIDECRTNGSLASRKYGSKVLIPVSELERFAEALPAWEPRSA